MGWTKPINMPQRVYSLNSIWDKPKHFTKRVDTIMREDPDYIDYCVDQGFALLADDAAEWFAKLKENVTKSDKY